MLPLVCNDAAAILFMVCTHSNQLSVCARDAHDDRWRLTAHPPTQFDLTRHETLDSIREWHRKARALNKCAKPAATPSRLTCCAVPPSAGNGPSP